MLSTNEALRFFRKNRQFTQKELLDLATPSSYSRIESGQRPLKLEELTEMLNRLSVTPDEFISLSDMNKDQKKIDLLFKNCLTKPDNKEFKQQLIDYYFKLKQKGNLSLRELSNYLAFRVHLSKNWTEIEQVDKKEIKELVKYFLKKEYYLQYDYRILGNILSLLNPKQTDQIIYKAIPIKSEHLRDSNTKESAYIVANNAITIKLYEKDFARAKEYIELAKKQDLDMKNLEYWLNIKYFSNLIGYLETFELGYLEKIHDYIKVLYDTGAKVYAKAIKNEVSQLLHDTDREKEIVITPINKR